MLQLDLTFHLFVCALAGAGAAVIAMVRTIILISDWLRAWSANWCRLVWPPGRGGIDYIPNCATYSKWPVLYCACNVFFKLNVLWGYFAVVVTRSTNDRNKPNSGGSLEGESARLCLQWYRRWVTKLFRYGGDQFCQIFLSTLSQLPCCYLMLSLSPAYQQCKLLLLLFFSCTGLFLRRFAGGWSLSQKRSLHLPRCFKN